MYKEHSLPKTFVDGKTPEAWCDLLAEMHGLKLSARKLRQIARETGQMDYLGKDMLLRPNHVDNLVKEMTCRLNSTREVKSFGSKDASKNYRTADITDKARAKLLKQARKRS